MLAAVVGEAVRAIPYDHDVLEPATVAATDFPTEIVVVMAVAALGVLLVSAISDRGHRGTAPAALTATATRQLEFDRASGGLTKRSMVVRSGAVEIAHVTHRRRLGRAGAVGHIRIDEGDYFYELTGGLWRRDHLTVLRDVDGARIGVVAKPESWKRRMALRGGVEFDWDGVAYDLRPAAVGSRTALRAHGVPVGTLALSKLSRKPYCKLDVPASLDDELLVIVLAAVIGFGFETRSGASGGGGSGGGGGGCG